MRLLRLIVFNLIPFLILTGILFSGAFYLYKKYRRDVAEHIHYNSFGIDIPGSYSIHGIDVSRYQGTIGWNAVKQMKENDISLGFVFIKATEGTDSVDPKFKYNWKESKEAGMIRGAYHFFIAGRSGKLQAKNFIKNVQLKKGDLPPVVDIEQLYGYKASAVRKELKIYLQELEKHYQVKPVIYTYVTFYEDVLQQEFDDYPLWIAHYLQPDQPRIQRSWSLWQHSESGNVDGIRSKVDFNVFNGDSVAFKKLLIP